MPLCTQISPINLRDPGSPDRIRPEKSLPPFFPRFSTQNFLKNSHRNIPRTLFLHAGMPGYRNRACHSPGTTPPGLPVIPTMLMLLCQRAPRDSTEVRTNTGQTMRPIAYPPNPGETSMARTAQSPRLLAPRIQRIQVAKRGGRLATPARPGRNQNKEKNTRSDRLWQISHRKTM